MLHGNDRGSAGTEMEGEMASRNLQGAKKLTVNSEYPHL